MNRCAPLSGALLSALLMATLCAGQTQAQTRSPAVSSVPRSLEHGLPVLMAEPAAPVPVLALGAPDLAAGRKPRLHLELRREVWLLSVAGRFWLASETVRDVARPVPPGGLEAGTIQWSVDRRVLGTSDRGASRMSDRTRQASLLLPLALSLVVTRGPDRWRDVAAGGVVYTEALLLTKTLTHLGKVAIGRPRPGLYASPTGSSFADGGVVGSGAFHSMPSSHASMAWTGAATALTTHLLLRPRAGWTERVGVGFVGGALAGATSALRVTAGAHFPSDVIAGAGIGIGSGVLVPLLHRGQRDLPSRGAWLQTTAGMALGTAVGIVLGSR